MEKHLIKWLINTIAIMLAIKLVPGIGYRGEWWGILLVGVIFGLINTFIRPVIKLLTLPFLIVSLGLFTFVINAMMLSVTSWISGEFRLGFHVDGFWPAFWGALIISIVSLVLSCLIPSDETPKVHIQFK
ncbi:MAG: phage holin family protein [Nitrospiraceae bacterium]|nr:phage holin family protein [Nitrospiraceae bacterium]